MSAALSKTLKDKSIRQRAQIRRAIEARLDKELRYTEKGIKVLSLINSKMLNFQMEKQYIMDLVSGDNAERGIEHENLYDNWRHQRRRQE